MDPQLVVLAAGLGSRYGGMKQLEAVGPGGQTLLEYSLYDARRAGFGDVVFVIRPDMRDVFTDYARARFGSRVRWRAAFQRLDDLPPGVTLPPGRAKPWGTAQAVLAATGLVDAPFAALNADDFYGAAAFTALAAFLRAQESERPALPTYAIVGYRLRDTVSQAGGVNRGLCRAGPDGWLEHVEEVVGVTQSSDGRYTGTGETGPIVIDGSALVSMNLWGFTPAVLDSLRQEFATFFRSPDAAQRELLIPTVIRNAVGAGRCRVRVLDAGSRWFGITHAADAPAVRAALRDLTEHGEYPERLWAS